MENKLAKKIADFIEYVTDYWLGILCGLCTCGFLVILILSNYITIPNTTPASTITLFTFFLGTTIAAFNIKTAKKNEILKLKKHEDNINDSLCHIMDDLVDFYSSIPDFFNASMKSEELINNGVSWTVPPKLNTEELFHFVKASDFIKMDNQKLVNSILNLTKEISKLATHYSKFVEVHSSMCSTIEGPLLLNIISAVEDEEPFTVGALDPQPKEFKAIYDFTEITVQLREQVFKTISEVYETTAITAYKSKSSVMERANRFFKTINKLDSAYPIKCLQISLAIDVNTAIEKVRSDKMKKIVLSKSLNNGLDQIAKNALDEEG